MSAVDRVFDEYVTEHRAGRSADPRAYLSRVSPGERAELATLIDGYLSRAPRRRFDPVAFRGSPAARTVDDLDRALGGVSGLWPTLLPRLRDRAGLRRGELVTRLAGELGLAGREGRVGEYYHRMEQGRLPAVGVSDRVLSALGEMLGQSVEALRSAGSGLSPAAETGSSPAFARTALTDDPPTAPAAVAGVSDAGPHRDEVDELFTGG